MHLFRTLQTTVKANALFIRSSKYPPYLRRFFRGGLRFAASAIRAELLPVKIYLSSDGLIYEKIYSIYQDSRGFIWFTTAIGMSRFDGYNFVNYGLENGLGC